MRHVSHMGEMRNVYKVSVGKRLGTRPLGRSRCRWEGNINMVLKIDYDHVDWFHLAQNRD
jgi:hypothetical protein